MFSKIKIFGHPIHPMLVAYPIAAYTGTLVGYSIYAATGGMFWLKLAIALNVVGVGMAVVAAVPGFIDWAFGIPRGTGAKKDGIKHGLLNTASLVLFAITLGIYAGHWNGPATSATAAVVLSAIGWLCTLAAGWYGWMLVQGWHVGVDLHESQVRSEPVLQEARARKAS
jgi:uncharacterized membrane protein